MRCLYYCVRVNLRYKDDIVALSVRMKYHNKSLH